MKEDKLIRVGFYVVIAGVLLTMIGSAFLVFTVVPMIFGSLVTTTGACIVAVNSKRKKLIQDRK